MHDRTRYRKSGRAESDLPDEQLLRHRLGEAARIDQCGQDNSGRAVLVIVKRRNANGFLHASLHLEALRRGDVLELNHAE